jgi:hypothetical protein
MPWEKKREKQGISRNKNKEHKITIKEKPETL